MKKSILLLDDNKEIHRLVSVALASPLVEITNAKTVEQAEKLIENDSFDLFLLDVELPDGSGVELCAKLQTKFPEIPVFFLSAHKDLSEKVLGFSVGADDYITKPFNPLELKARVEAKLKKIDLLKSGSDLLEWDELKINKSTQEVQITVGDEEQFVELTALEFKLLTYLADRVGEVLDRDRILNEIWGDDVHVYSRSVDTHISKLRKKLGPISHIIESVHGAGYKFAPTQ